jgi:glucose-1-phosphate cytidylyltransferase
VKVVLFCGGLGTRLRAHTGTIPKSMVPVGTRPILWHLMRYYAHHGHTEFILCLGHRGEAIRRFFTDVLRATPAGEVRPPDGGAPWCVTYVDSGIDANVGQRLKAAESCLGNDAVFLANYSDALTDLDLRAYLDSFARHDKLAAFACVRPHQSFHVVELDPTGRVVALRAAADSGVRINGGFFVFKRAVFAHIGEGEDLVEAPFRRLIGMGQLLAHRHDGFWHCMDTYKDKQAFDSMVTRGTTPWQVWQHGAAC